MRQELLNTGVQVQEANGQIYLIMPGNITFDSNDANIKPAFQPVLNSIAKVINEYSKTMVQVNGYTDSTGSAATNNSLSLMRANSISNYLRLKGVAADRIVSNGYGSSNPIASNATAAGREQNRRVEIVLINRYSRPDSIICSGGFTAGGRSRDIIPAFLQSKTPVL